MSPPGNRPKRVRLPVLEANHAVIAELKPRRSKSKYPSVEIQRDSAIEIEPLPYEAAGGPASDVENYRQHVKYRAARALAGSAPAPIATPRTRGDCPSDRHAIGCGAFRCRFHLWRDDAPAGRPGLASVPRDPLTGFTVVALGNFGPKAPPRLEPRWLEQPLPSSCALDVADEGPRLTQAIGDITDRHRTLVLRVLKTALRKLAAQGYAAVDVLRLIDPDVANDQDRGPSKAATGRRRG